MAHNGNEEVSEQVQTKLCVKCYEFFGNPASMDMCSKCYRDFSAREAANTKQAETIRKALESPTVTPAAETSQTATPSVVVEPVPTVTPAPNLKTPETPVSAPESTAASPATIAGPSGTPPPQKHKNRCFSCNKKVGLTGFACRCGYIFCAEHRYSDKHECAFDFKAQGKKQLTTANPVIAPAKLETL